MWVVLSPILLVGIYVPALYCALRAAQTARTPQGAVGWVVFLLATPFLGIPTYMILGHHRLKRHIVSRRESKQVVTAIAQHSSADTADFDTPPSALPALQYCAEMPALRGNSMQVLIDGPDTFQAIFDAIDRAQSYALVQFYIIRDDDTGRALRDHLISAVQRGVTVRLITDAVGSYTLPTAYLSDLREAGVIMPDSGTAPGPKRRGQINFRNHRKTVVVDGTVGFTGGLNIGDEYAGSDPDYGPWRDTHVQLTGPMVSQLQLIFAEDWHWATGDVLLDDLNWDPPHDPDDMTGLIVPTGPGDQVETGSLMFFSAIIAARERVWIASPYFVPDTDIIAALRHAAVQGVDVRILVPDMADHQLPWLAAYSFFDDLRADGVRVFRYFDGFMHQKTFVVDDTMAAIGTANLDNRSFRLNFETMAIFFDSRAADRLDKMFRADFSRSFEVFETLSEQPPYVRYGAPVARLFAPLL